MYNRRQHRNRKTRDLHFVDLPRIMAMCAISAVVFSVSGLSADNKSHGSIVRIEEDWEMRVQHPDVNLAAPQTSTIMIPSTLEQDTLFTFEINFSTAHNFREGGLQVHAWTDDQHYNYQPQASVEPMRWQNESIRWTQRLELDGNTLRFSVPELKSQSFGNLNNHELLVLEMPTKLSSLNDYSIEDSLAQSGVLFASNRIRHFTLKSVRWYDANGLVKEEVVNTLADE